MTIFVTLGWVLSIVWGTVVSITTIVFMSRYFADWMDVGKTPSKFDFIAVGTLITLTVVLWWACWALSGMLN